MDFKKYENKLDYPPLRFDISHIALDNVREKRKAYRAEGARLEALFRHDLEEEFGTAGHRKASLLYSKAWEKGHSSGLSEVYYAYADLVELIKD